jgi:hypothetical protein
MNTVKIRSERDIWFLNSYTGRTELLRRGVHTIVGEADYVSLAKMFGKEIILIEEPKSEKPEVRLKAKVAPKKRARKSK